MTIQFEAGTTYSTHSICDSNQVISITVASRTAKTIKLDTGKTLRVSIYEGYETVMPFGRYSMAPIIRANRPDEPKAEVPDTVEQMLSSSEFARLFNSQEREAIESIVASLSSLNADKPQHQHQQAKVIDLAAYRANKI